MKKYLHNGNGFNHFCNTKIIARESSLHKYLKFSNKTGISVNYQDFLKSCTYKKKIFKYEILFDSFSLPQKYIYFNKIYSEHEK